MPELSLNQRIASLFHSASELDEEVAPVQGEFPSWLHGSFLRTGPGKFDLGEEFTVNHLLDGYALLTKFDLMGDQVRLKKKYLESEAYKRAISAKKPLVLEFGTRGYPDKSKSIFSRYMPTIIPELSDNGNFNIYNVGKETFTGGELCFFHEVNRSTLCNGDRFDSQKYFGCQLLSSHPLVDEDGSTYTIGLSFLTGVKYNIIRIPPTTGDQKMKDVIKKHKTIASVPSSHATLLSYVHSFGMTKNYILLIEQPYLISVPKVLSAAVRKSDCLQDWIEWKPEMKCRFIVVRKDTGKIFKTDYFSHEAFFFLHVINCYEEKDQIVLDISAFKNTEFLDSLSLEKLRKGENDVPEDVMPRGIRFVLPLVDLKSVSEGVNLVTGIPSKATALREGNHIVLTPEILTKAGLEFPTINRNFLSKKTNFYYATGWGTRGHFENAVTKVDISLKETVLLREEFCFFGEPLFVARPNGTNEDDGVVLVAVNNTGGNKQDFLLCLDAQSMKELARVYFKSPIPQSLHGCFSFSSQ